LRFLLRPEWLALTLAVLTFAGACYALLAPWQFSRHEQRSATNAAIRASFTAPPAPLADLLPPGTAPDQRTEWRLARVTGTYLPAAEAVARLRSVQSEPAFEVLTPLRLTDGSVVLVDRGFVRPTDTADVPSYPAPPTGQVDLLARIRSDEQDPQRREPIADSGRRQVYAVDSQTVGHAAGLTMRPGYLQLESGSPGVLGPLPLPQLDGGPFLSYALQWIAFGTMALLAWAYFSWREIKPGGALAAQASDRPKRRSVAQQIAAEEAAERAAQQRV
jgi:cytochrome oxidase assembly protein ShyY1